MRATSTLLALAAASLFAGDAQAAQLRLALNHSARLHLNGPAASVVVGSPSIIDVSVVDSRTVFVSGKSPGTTDVTVVDPLGRIVYRGDIQVGGGAMVTVFRGSARTDSACAPYCDTAGGATPSNPTVAALGTGVAAGAVLGMAAASNAQSAPAPAAATPSLALSRAAAPR